MDIQQITERWQPVAESRLGAALAELAQFETELARLNALGAKRSKELADIEQRTGHYPLETDPSQIVMDRLCKPVVVELIAEIRRLARRADKSAENVSRKIESVIATLEAAADESPARLDVETRRYVSMPAATAPKLPWIE